MFLHAKFEASDEPFLDISEKCIVSSSDAAVGQIIEEEIDAVHGPVQTVQYGLE